MKVIINGTQISIHGDEEIIIKDKIPAACYNVCFSKFTGIYLEKREPLQVKEKVYGKHMQKVKKAFNSFENMNRSMGIILSGAKGIGKSMFTNIIAEKAMEKDYPVIIVQGMLPELDSFLGSITQECIVIFDEFEKNFRYTEDEGRSEQEGLLSMFDGLDNTKKMFIITCNKVYELSDYLINRPGRFHYHFKLTNPSQEEIREYLNDNVLDEYKSKIEDIVTYSIITDMTYDWLRAITFELNQGYEVSEIFEDLNIESCQSVKFFFSAIIDGFPATAYSAVTVGENSLTNVYFMPLDNGDEYILKFNSRDLTLHTDGTISFDSESYSIRKRFETEPTSNDIIRDIKVRRVYSHNIEEEE